MDALQFAYWLNGFVELNGAPPNQQQWDSIKQHLGLVFTKVTPPVNPYCPPILGAINAPNTNPNRPMAIC